MKADGASRWTTSPGISLMRPSGLAALRARASVFAALGDETRLSVLARLSHGAPQSISRLTAGTRLSRQAVTKHLPGFADAGVVRSTRARRESLFELEPKPIGEAREYLDDVSRPLGRALAWLA